MMKEGTYPQPEQGASQEMLCENCPSARRIGAKAVGETIYQSTAGAVNTFSQSEELPTNLHSFRGLRYEDYQEIMEQTFRDMARFREEVLEITDSSGLWRLQTEPRRRSLIDKVVGYIRAAIR